jgi:hypothetical protein
MHWAIRHQNNSKRKQSWRVVRGHEVWKVKKWGAAALSVQRQTKRQKSSGVWPTQLRRDAQELVRAGVQNCVASEGKVAL